MKIILFSIIFGILFIGCATRSDMSTNINLVSIGMSKKDVIQSVGQPNSISAKGNIEYLNYQLCDRDMADFPAYSCIKWGNYYVRIIDNKVESYGNLGDFDSTKVSETKQTIELNIK